MGTCEITWENSSLNTFIDKVTQEVLFEGEEKLTIIQEDEWGLTPQQNLAIEIRKWNILPNDLQSGISNLTKRALVELHTLLARFDKDSSETITKAKEIIVVKLQKISATTDDVSKQVDWLM